jgi:hypothetical protein
MCSWFLGARGENAGIMKEMMSSTVDHVKAGRVAFGSEDEVRLLAKFPYRLSHITAPATQFLQDFVTTAVADSSDFKDSIADLQAGVDFLGKQLSKHSVPFFSPRYAAHMNSDISSE